MATSGPSFADGCVMGTRECFHRLLKRFPLPEPKVVHSVHRAAKP